MASYNKVIIMGNLCAEPELKVTPTGKNVVKVALAVSRPKTQKNPNPITDFFEIEAWGAIAEFIARYFTKGKPIHIDGRLENQAWTDRETGAKKVKTVIKVEHATFTENKDSALSSYRSPLDESTPAYESPSVSNGFEEIPAGDDLPF